MYNFQFFKTRYFILKLIDRFRGKYLVLIKWRLRKHCFKSECILNNYVTLGFVQWTKRFKTFTFWSMQTYTKFRLFIFTRKADQNCALSFLVKLVWFEEALPLKDVDRLLLMLHIATGSKSSSFKDKALYSKPSL